MFRAEPFPVGKPAAIIMHWLYIAAVVSFIIFFVLFFTQPEEPTFLFGYAEGITLGIPFVMVSVGAIMTSKYAAKIQAFKKRVLKREM